MSVRGAVCSVVVGPVEAIGKISRTANSCHRRNAVLLCLPFSGIIFVVICVMHDPYNNNSYIVQQISQFESTDDDRS